jgi:hypothetical protein
MENSNKLFIMCPACKIEHGFDTTWSFNGDYDKPTINPSILVTMPYFYDVDNYRCHSFVRDGNIEFLNDCTHELAGQTVELLDFEED